MDLKKLVKTLPLIKLIRSKACMENEQKGLIQSLRNTKVAPMDVSFMIDHYLGESHYKTPLFRIGVDVTVINTTESSASTSANARFQNTLLRLQAGEQKKLERPRGGSKTNGRTQVTLSGDEITGEIVNKNMVMIPFLISLYGMFGSLISRFLYGTEPLPLY